MEKASPITDESNQCTFIVIRKKRRCQMQRRDGEPYCPEHCTLMTSNGNNGNEKRIPCPLDPKHTCDEKQLEKHLKKCNSRPVPKPYISPKINIADPNSIRKGNKLVNYSDEIITETMRKVEGIVTTQPQWNTETHMHFQSQLEELKQCRSSWKHLVQNAAIAECMKSHNLLSRKFTYVELGSGRGQLSHSIAQVVATESSEHPTDFVLVDKASQRHKFDVKIQQLENFKSQRIKADISDLILNNLPIVHASDAIIVIAKHLCGGGTDVALKCISNCEKVVGVVIAICCHHKCTWSSYCNQETMINSGMSDQEFDVLTKIASWYTCGMVTDSKECAETDPDHQCIEQTDQLNRYELMGLDTAKRQNIGVKSKAVINQGRLHFLKDLGFETSLVHYVEPDVSLENVLLIAVKK